MIDTPSPLLYLLGSAIPFVIAGIEIAWLVRYTIGLRHLLASTRSIASLVPGEIVIVRGRLRVEGEPALDDEDRPCAWVIRPYIHIPVGYEWPKNADPSAPRFARGNDVASKLFLEDSKGGCRICLDNADLLGAMQRAERPELAVTSVVPLDAVVSLRGRVFVDDEVDPSDYRDGHSPVMMGSDKEPLQVLVGSPAMLLFRSAAVTAALAVLIAVTLAVGVFSLRISLALRGVAGL